MAELLFGTAGVPRSAKSTATQSGIERIAELGLGNMEVEFVRGVKMRHQTALSLGQLAAQKGVELTVHGPYYINFNAHEPEKLVASQERLIESARRASSLGAQGVVFHAAYYLGDSPSLAYANVKKYLGEVVKEMQKEGNRVILRPEVTGKPTQFGTLEELIQLSQESAGVAPCVDFAHWHARTGKANSYAEFLAILEQIETGLGREALDKMHIHISGIDYGRGGEKKHLNLSQSDFRYQELLRALKDKRAKGIVVCESPNLEEDALLLQRTYLELH
jgi:deoxyribonuclease-4